MACDVDWGTLQVVALNGLACVQNNCRGHAPERNAGQRPTWGTAWAGKVDTVSRFTYYSYRIVMLQIVPLNYGESVIRFELHAFPG